MSESPDHAEAPANIFAFSPAPKKNLEPHDHVVAHMNVLRQRRDAPLNFDPEPVTSTYSQLPAISFFSETVHQLESAVNACDGTADFRFYLWFIARLGGKVSLPHPHDPIRYIQFKTAPLPTERLPLVRAAYIELDAAGLGFMRNLTVMNKEFASLPCPVAHHPFYLGTVNMLGSKIDEANLRSDDEFQRLLWMAYRLGANIGTIAHNEGAESKMVQKWITRQPTSPYSEAYKQMAPLPSTDRRRNILGFAMNNIASTILPEEPVRKPWNPDEKIVRPVFGGKPPTP